MDYDKIITLPEWAVHESIKTYIYYIGNVTIHNQLRFSFMLPYELEFPIMDSLAAKSGIKNKTITCTINRMGVITFQKW